MALYRLIVLFNVIGGSGLVQDVLLYVTVYRPLPDVTSHFPTLCIECHNHSNDRKLVSTRRDLFVHEHQATPRCDPFDDHEGFHLDDLPLCYI
ncbi:hypothetical protein GALMADRAFT_238514 [Galerina marginata CBS 339.88]|uniref:Uncharacterized protein n=1 Tax=Galerina marginata (strain CBS 339.88) TaxID=685588 RepID=A0A067TIA9_GALM3|nr:hypothetical protein GALMADRAFT_238514 [Galerina marginata CBS 339.88]